MTFKDQTKIDMAAVFLNTGEFANAATYAATEGATPITLTVVPRLDLMIQEFEGVAGRNVVLEGSTAEVSDPQIHGVITLDTGEICKIMQIISIDPAGWQVFCVSDQRIYSANLR